MSAQGAVQRPRRGRWTASDREVLPWVLLFLSPWIIGLIVFTIIPMGWSLWLSFTDYDPLTRQGDFIGVENYVDMVGDKRVWTSLYNTVYFTLLYVPLSTILGLILALMLNKVGGASAGFFRTAFYLPNLTPAVAVGVLFLLILNGQAGVLNQFLGIFGINGPSWLNDTAWVKNGIVLMMLWSIGGTVIIYFAALRNVPGELYEAAKIDGAGPWKQFLNVTVPMISGALFFTIVINTIYSLQLFSEVWTMFYGAQQGQGATGDAALFYVIYLFRNAFEFFKMGYASALAWVLFIVIMLITLVQLRVSKRFVYYEGE
ncbi:MAG TPA: sugar ABC transporter permease [Candidatus Limnocylindria bacterium]|nr:sugar ABC transporter permease [Candidatus Limnocylindria bacterium]